MSCGPQATDPSHRRMHREDTKPVTPCKRILPRFSLIRGMAYVNEGGSVSLAGKGGTVTPSGWVLQLTSTRSAWALLIALWSVWIPNSARASDVLPHDATWDVWLSESPQLGDLPRVDVIDVDLFDTPEAVIAGLHAQGTAVVCYFSAGSAENWRPDFAQLQPHRGRRLQGWAREWWLDVRQPQVLAVMSQRIALAEAKGCDGVDPDNVDGYQNATDLGLTKDDALQFLTFLATEAHEQGLEIGLKNALDLVPEMVGIMDFAVNEQCLVYRECAALAPFVDAGKPVVHIEYATPRKARGICTRSAGSGFVTIVKRFNLDHRGVACS